MTGMNDWPYIPEKVLIRHTCSCDTAVERPAGTEPEEHRFEVDGKDFPWFLSARGPVVTRYADDLWRIDIDLFAIDHDTWKTLPIAVTPGMCGGADLEIGGVAFPWLMTQEGWTLTSSSKQLLTLTLGFFTRNVDTNMPYTDQREVWADRAIYANGGDCYKAGKDQCHWCDALVDSLEMFAHHEQEHPEHISTSKDGLKGIQIS